MQTLVRCNLSGGAFHVLYFKYDVTILQEATEECATLLLSRRFFSAIALPYVRMRDGSVRYTGTIIDRKLVNNTLADL